MRKINTKEGEVPLPCLDVKIVAADKVRANNYNPNAVADNNMELLKQSIMDNGFCYPIVTVYDDETEEYIIVDGFHRFTILKDYLGAKEIPITVLGHGIAKRMAATVQFNRARGVHQVELMGDLVKSLSEQGMQDQEIASHLGMEEEEVYRLKQVTGIAEIFKNQIYSKSWEMTEVATDE